MGMAAAVRHHMTGVSLRLSATTVARIHIRRTLVFFVTAAITVSVVSSMTIMCVGIAWRDSIAMSMGIRRQSRLCSRLRSRLRAHAAQRCLEVALGIDQEVGACDH